MTRFGAGGAWVMVMMAVIHLWGRQLITNPSTMDGLFIFYFTAGIIGLVRFAAVKYHAAQRKVVKNDRP